MGIKSTYDITRETAIRIIQSKIYNCTDEQIEMMLEQFDESYFRNYSIVAEIPEKENEEYDRSIRRVEDF